jgi:hypothetical protein
MRREVRLVRTAVALLVVLALPARAAEAPVGARESGEAFTAQVEAPAKVSVGERATLRVRVEATRGFHTNEDYPHAARLRGDGVELPARVSLERGASSLSASIPFTARTAGARPITIDLAFAMCDANRCLIEKRTLTLSVEAR